MERSRTIAAAPVRSAMEAWQLVVDLLTETLERSSAVPAGSVSDSLSPLRGIGPALIAGGHLEAKGLLLVDESLHVTIHVVTGDAALDVDESMNPIPGGASATANWTLYMPQSGPLDVAISRAVKGAAHLSCDNPSANSGGRESVARTSESTIDLDALKRLGERP
jgi:hypothetical protein